MTMLELAPLSNGAHRNQTATATVPNGWAVIPSDMTIPDTFPFVDIEAENGIVTSMTAGVVPEPDPIEPAAPTMEERMTAVEDAVEILLNGDTEPTTEVQSNDAG